MSMINPRIFAAIGRLAVSAKKRRDAEYQDFLAFYRTLVETLPAEVCAIFGNMGGIEVQPGAGARTTFGLELSATDFIWWKHKIEVENVRFVKSAAAIKADMLARISRGAEAHNLTPAERKELVALLETTGELA
jgi:hypothetical protein